MSSFDLTVLGAGPGGYVAAIRAAQLGLKVALVERRATLGGTCLNVGCIPSKALLDSSELFARLRDEASTHGISVGTPKIDVPTMLARKNQVVEKLTAGVAMLIKANKITVYQGNGWIVDPTHIEVRDVATGAVSTTIETKRLLIATGSVPIEIPTLPIDGSTVVDSTGALQFDRVPKELIIVGGGVIGLELGSVWARLGSAVTVVELLGTIMTGWDAQVQKTMQRELSKQGFTFLLNTRVNGVEVKKGRATLSATDPAGKELKLSADKVLVAVGRRAVLEGFNLEALPLQVVERKIAVDGHYQTAVPGVYAIGDVVSGPMLAHKAEDEGIAAVECMVGKAGHVNYQAIPNVVYTWPEAAAVGRSEEQLQAAGVAYAKGVFPFAANGRALAMGSTAGFVKILADAGNDRVLGAHIVGPWASDLIAEVATVIEFGGSAEDIARTVHAHPTLTEAVKEAALGVDGRMIHAK